MNAIRQAVAIATLATLPIAQAFASQGPGTTGGTATMLDKTIFLSAVAAAVCVGLALRLRHR